MSSSQPPSKRRKLLILPSKTSSHRSREDIYSANELRFSPRRKRRHESNREESKDKTWKLDNQTPTIQKFPASAPEASKPSSQQKQKVSLMERLKFISHKAKPSSPIIASPLLDELLTPPTPESPESHSSRRKSTKSSNKRIKSRTKKNPRTKSPKSPYLSLPQELLDIIFSYHLFEIFTHSKELLPAPEIQMYRDFGFSYHFGRRVNILDFFSQIIAGTETKRKNAWLDKLPLRYVDMSMNYSVDDSVFAFLHGVQTLDISGCENLTDFAFSHLTGIKHLNMSKCTHARITDAAFQHLSGIEWLDMSYAPSSVTGKAFKYLSGIQHLNIAECNRNRIASEHFEHLHGIQWLNISGCNQFDDDTMVHLKGIHTLIANNVHHSMTGDALVSLSGIHTLSIAHLPHLSPLVNEHFMNLSTNLHTLDLRWCRSVDLTVEMFFSIGATLKVLLMSEFAHPLTSELFAHICGVERLDISQCDMSQVKDADLRQLAGIRQLDMSFPRNFPPMITSAFVDFLVQHGLEVIDIRSMFKTKVAREVENRLLDLGVQCVAQ